MSGQLACTFCFCRVHRSYLSLELCQFLMYGGKEICACCMSFKCCNCILVLIVWYVIINQYFSHRSFSHNYFIINGSSIFWSETNFKTINKHANSSKNYIIITNDKERIQIETKKQSSLKKLCNTVRTKRKCADKGTKF